VAWARTRKPCKGQVEAAVRPWSHGDAAAPRTASSQAAPVRLPLRDAPWQCGWRKVVERPPSAALSPSAGLESTRSCAKLHQPRVLELLAGGTRHPGGACPGPARPEARCQQAWREASSPEPRAQRPGAPSDRRAISAARARPWRCPMNVEVGLALQPLRRPIRRYSRAQPAPAGGARAPPAGPGNLSADRGDLHGLPLVLRCRLKITPVGLTLSRR